MARRDSTSNMNKMVLASTGFLSYQKKSRLWRKWLSDNVLADIINESITLSDIDKVTTT